MNLHLLIVIILFSLGNAADNFEVQTRVRPASQADSALTGTLAEVDEKEHSYVKGEEIAVQSAVQTRVRPASQADSALTGTLTEVGGRDHVYVKGEGIAVQSTNGCGFVEIVETREHASNEGVYQETSQTCDGKPIWQKMAGSDKTNINYLYFMSTLVVGASWYHGPSPCSSTVYAYARSSANRPGDATGWMEVSSANDNFQTSPMSVTCKADAPCSRLYVKNVPSLHSDKEGEYQRDGVCSYRPAYRKGNTYLYYAISSAYSGWLITSGACTESTVSVNMRNLDNTGYPQDVASAWQYYSNGWKSSTSVVVDCESSARGIHHTSVTALAVMIAYCLGQLLFDQVISS